MAKQKLTKEQKKGKTLASMSFTAGLAAFIAAYSGSVLKKSFLSKAFTFVEGLYIPCRRHGLPDRALHPGQGCRSGRHRCRRLNDIL